MADVTLSKLAEALKTVNDVGTEFLKQCMDKKPAADGKIAVDVEALRDALSSAFMCIGPRAKDAEATTTTREKAHGDKARGNDSRHFDPRFSINSIFSADGERAPLEHSLDSVFLAKG